MKRLVYSPSIKVWVKADSGIIDLSPYVTNCSIHRAIDDVSKAEITFRNPKFTSDNGKKRFMFTENELSDGSIRPVFHPMDPITIVFERIKGRPVQVFTGYCDTTPYVQLFPGVAKISASCTLKRLLYTYWDPALPFVRSFMKAYGWDVSNEGQAINQGQATKAEKSTGNTKIKSVTLNDSSIGNLLWAVLHEIGGWNDNNIYIQPLPANIGSTVAKLMDEFTADNKRANQEVADLLSRIVGTGTYGAAITGGLSAAAGGNGNVTMVGDSITHMSEAQLQSKMPNITIYAHDNKRMSQTTSIGGDSGLKILQDHRNALGSVVVIALGTNDIGYPAINQQTFEGYINQAVSIIGSSRPIVFVNIAAAGGDFINRAINASRARHSNISVADWKSHAEVGPDNVHPTTHGQTVFAEVVATAVSAVMPQTSTSSSNVTPGNGRRTNPQTITADWEPVVRAYSGSNYGVDHLNSLLAQAPQNGSNSNDRAITQAAARNWKVPFALLWATYGAESSWGKAASSFGLTGKYGRSGTSGNFTTDANESAKTWLQNYRSHYHREPNY